MELFLESSLIVLMSLVFVVIGAFFLRQELSRRQVGLGQVGVSRTALKVERNYKIFAWLILELVMLSTLLNSLYSLIRDVLAWSV